MYSLIFYVPNTHLETVKEAVFTAGAGTIGDYKHCCWQVLGQGQFQPLPGSQPFIGQHDQLEQVPEWRVELVVAASHIKSVVTALKAAHPYEEPAYAVYRLETF
ncbi:MAG TPA: NGG1p interacting factor NIF3 [Thiopseudomonas sp.]|nr:NGG1p interacting factor NIF3 [Thiopseudomonas sp.]